MKKNTYRFQKLTLFDLNLTWSPSKVRLDDIMGPNHITINIYTNWARKHVATCKACCDFYLSVIFCYLTLTLTILSMIFMLMQ